MIEKGRFDTQQARAYCMNYGTIVGIVCCISFLCAVYGLRHPGLSLVSNIAGLMAFVGAGRLIRRFRREVTEISFGRACWMAFSIYFYAILLTAAVQYAYFAFLDHGMLAEYIRMTLETEEFRNLLTSMAGNEDMNAIVESMLTPLLSPVKATIQMLWMNCTIALILILPTAFMGMKLKVKS